VAFFILRKYLTFAFKCSSFATGGLAPPDPDPNVVVSQSQAPMLRKLGSYGAFLQALSYLTLLILYLVIYPSEGFNDTMMTDAGQMLSFSLAHPALLKLQYLTDLGFAMGMMVLTLALFRRFRGRHIDTALLILGTGMIGSTLFLVAGVMGIVNIDQTVQFANGQVSQSFTSLVGIQGGLEVAAIFAAGWTGFFMALAGVQSKVWKNWMNACGFIGAAGSILMMPLYVVSPALMGVCMMLGILGMVFNAGIGFSLSTKASEQAFELDPASAR
jgi:hypothetical protein